MSADHEYQSTMTLGDMPHISSRVELRVEWGAWDRSHIISRVQLHVELEAFTCEESSTCVK